MRLRTFGFLSVLLATNVLADATHAGLVPSKLFVSFSSRPCIPEVMSLRGKMLVQTWSDKPCRARKDAKIKTFKYVPTEVQWREFRRNLDELNVWGWRGEYENPRVMDGEGWSLTVEYSDRAIASQGVNAYPEAFSRYRLAVHKLAGMTLFGRRRSELEFYDVGQLQLVATSGVRKQGQPWADFRDPEGKVHRARIGTYVGLDYGRIVEIAEATVKIRGIVQAASGDWVERDTIARTAGLL